VPEIPACRQPANCGALLSGGMGTRIYFVTFGGFDTNANQPNQHANLLGGLSNSVAAFLQAAAGLGVADRVLLLTFSEFGRRVHENGSQGTDHGTAAPMFVIDPSEAESVLSFTANPAGRPS
jgi:uncharacterized protein (DUF1501 family)